MEVPSTFFYDSHYTGPDYRAIIKSRNDTVFISFYNPDPRESYVVNLDIHNNKATSLVSFWFFISFTIVLAIVLVISFYFSVANLRSKGDQSTSMTESSNLIEYVDEDESVTVDEMEEMKE